MGSCGVVPEFLSVGKKYPAFLLGSVKNGGRICRATVYSTGVGHFPKDMLVLE